ncbi:MAG TPA: anti-sigma factor [Actinomycetota bacterium]|nr:anti-sigma factor [Actinomycetota bacterium]
MTVCDDHRLDFHPYVLGELPPDRAQEVRRHVDGCGACARELVRVGQVHKLLVDAPLDHTPPPGLEDDVFSLVALEPVGSLVSNALPAADPPDDLERAALLRAGVLAPRRSRATTVLVPALGVATVVLGILGINWRSEADRMRDDFGPVGQTMQLVNLSGSPEPPAETTVELVRYGDSSYKVVIDGPVPPAPDGYYYEMWMSGPTGRVSCGTFTVGDDETVHNFSIGVDPADYPYLEITLEPDDGNEEMNGEVQWQGELVGASS